MPVEWTVRPLVGVTKPSAHFKKEQQPRRRPPGEGGGVSGPEAKTKELRLELQIRELEYRLQKQNALMEEKNREILKLSERIETD